MKPRLVFALAVLIFSMLLIGTGAAKASITNNLATTDVSQTITGVTTRISVSSDGVQGNDRSWGSTISSDGQVIAFYSYANNLVSGDTNGSPDVFVYDKQVGQTSRVSVVSNGTQGNGPSYSPSISADGRYIAFESDASNLVSGDTNNISDIFVHDRQTGETTRVSVASDGTQGNGWSVTASISADGRYIAFGTFATNLVPNDLNNQPDIFVRDRQTGTTTRISVASDGTEGNGRSDRAAVSSDGRYIAFDSEATNLVSGDTNGYVDVFIHDRQTGETNRISVASGGVQSNQRSQSDSISADGRYVVFGSNASNLVNGDTNDQRDIFVYDRQMGDTSRVSVASDGVEGNNASSLADVSSDGRYIVFDSLANNLIPDDTNGVWDTFAHDRQTGETTRISVASDGAEGNGRTLGGVISADGRYIAFTSEASNLVSGDTNGVYDVFLHDRGGALIPAAITDLQASTGAGQGQVLLSWTAPQGITSNMTYQVRHASTVIETELAWISATSASGTPTPSPAGTPQNMIVSGLTPGQNYYFSIRVEYEPGSLSNLSNSPSAVAGNTIDLFFRPNPDGYEFANYGGVNNDDFTIDDMRQMFGDGAVCWMAFSNCIPKPQASQWKQQVHTYMEGGHCDGFTITSLRFFKGIDNPSDFQSDASATHDLELSNIRRHIAYYWVLQVPEPVATARNQALQKTPTQVLNQLIDAMSNGAVDPTSLIVYNSDGSSGHSITPYSIEDRGNGVYWVFVYDNNYPNDADRYIEINTTNDTWSYDMGGTLGVWSGDTASHSLGAIPISAYTQQPECPWCNGTGLQRNSQNGQSQTWLDGQGHLLITNSQGQSIGYLGDQYVNEVPGAFGSVLPGGLGIPAEPVYYLPITDTYTILLDGQTLMETENVAITQYGPGYAASVRNVALLPASQDTIVFSPDGKQIDFSASSSKEITLTLAVDNFNESYQFQIQQADVGMDQVIGLEADLVEGQLSLSHAEAGSGTYTIGVTRVNSSGEMLFLHTDINVNANDTHYFDFGTWDGTGSMSVCTDHGSDGSLDTCETLSNESPHGWETYLPLVLR